jgi:hypothetical protein
MGLMATTWVSLLFTLAKPDILSSCSMDCCVAMEMIESSLRVAWRLRQKSLSCKKAYESWSSLISRATKDLGWRRATSWGAYSGVIETLFCFNSLVTARTMSGYLIAGGSLLRDESLVKSSIFTFLLLFWTES